MQDFSLQKGVRIAGQQLRRGEEEAVQLFFRRDSIRWVKRSRSIRWSLQLCDLEGKDFLRLDEHDLKTYVNNVVAVPADADLLNKYMEEMARAKRFILDGVRDHVLSHIAGKDIARQMWEALATLYE